MIIKAWLLPIGLVLAGICVETLQADAPAHPILLFTGSDLPAIRARIGTSGFTENILGGWWFRLHGLIFRRLP